MVADVILTKVESARQAAEMGALAGKTVVVTDVSSATKLATLTPDGGSAVTVKLDATRQIAELKALAGKSVLVGKTPTALGGIGNWMSLTPVAEGATAAASTGTASNSLVMMKVVGGEAAAQLPALAGKTYTVVAPPAASAAGKTVPMLYLKQSGAAAGAELLKLPVQDTAFAQASSLTGKTFTVAKSPVVGANFGQFLVLKPTAAVGAKAATGGLLAAKLGSTVAATGKTATAAAGAATVAAGNVLSPAVAALNPVASASAGSTLLAGKGVGLGLGLGMGAWGPVVLGVIGLAGALSLVAYVRDRSKREPVSHQALMDELAAEAKA
nr:Magnetosome protein MamD [uncultured bacterium]